MICTYKTLHAGFSVNVNPVLARLGVKVLAPIFVEAAAGAAEAGSHLEVTRGRSGGGESN